MPVSKYGYIYAYEVDGLGHAILTDDANIPSLLSAPYIGYTAPNDRYYLNTRAFLLSQDNPSFYKGKSRAASAATTRPITGSGRSR